MGRHNIEDRCWHIYKVCCRVNGKSYIGLTNGTVKQRWSNHVSQAKRGNKRSILHRAIRKHGPAAFDVEVLLVVWSRDDASAAERRFIASCCTLLPNGYNVTDGGVGTPGFRKPHSPETRAKIGAANKVRVHSAETRERMAEAKRGKKLSEQHRTKLSDAHRGIPRTALWLANQSAACTGKNYPRRSIALLEATLSGGAPSSSGYRGVTQDGEKWIARIGIDRRRVHLGTFNTKEQAAAAYRHAAQKRSAELRMRVPD